MTKQQQVETILKIVSKYTGIPVYQIQSKRRYADIAEAKHMARYMLYHYTTLSQKLVIKETGGINHTSTLCSLKRLSDLCYTEKSIKQIFDSIEYEISKMYDKQDKMHAQKEYTI